MELFANKFEEAAYKERLFFRNLRKLYNLFPDDKWFICETHYTDTQRYDYLIYTKEGQIKRLIIEIKIRSTVEEDYFYETIKHNSLTKAKNLDPDNNTIIYINSTPEGTFIWNIDKIITNYKPTTRKMNAATMASTTNKEDKDVYCLNKEDAKHYSYHWDEAQFHEHIEALNIKQDKNERRLRSDEQLFNLLFKK